MDVQFEGPRYYPASAAVSILGTTSAVLSGLCARIPGPAPLTNAIETIVALFCITALGCSVHGAFSLMISGPEQLGKLKVRGRQVPEMGLWSGYMLAFLFPWAFLLVAAAHWI